MRRVHVLAGCALVLAAAGCEVVAGIDDRTANPLLDGGSGTSGSSGTAGSSLSGSAGASAGSGGAQAGASSGAAGTAGASVAGAAGTGGAGAGGTGGAGGGGSCLPVGMPNVRFGNLVPDPGRYALCLKPMGGSAPGILFAGASCGAGLGYKDVSALFHVDPGAYDVSLVDGKATDCTSPALATLSPAVVQDGQLTAFYALGDGVAAPVLKRFVESRPTNALGAKFRAVHASAAFGDVDTGLGDASQLPATILAPTFVDLSYGTTAAPGTTPQGQIDANGYLEIQTGGAALAYVVAPTGKTQGELATSIKLDGGRAYSMFIVGTPSVPGFPLQIMTCDEVANTANNLAKCTQGVPVEVTLDTYNAQLNGIFVVQPPSLRLPTVAAGVAKLAGDVACITEVFDEATKQAIIDAAKADYPYSYFAKTTLDTPVDDPTDASGMVPPAQPAACAASAAKMKTALDCVRDNCVAPKGDEAGVPAEGVSSCLADKCTGALLGLLLGGAEDKRCWGCVFQQLNGQKSIGATRTACSSDPKARYTLDGQNGSLILSKHPIASSEFRTLPATDFRVSVLRSVITLPNGAEIDTYCSDHTTPSTSCTTRPYTGQYGGVGATCTDQWNNELILQSKKLAAWVSQKSTSLKRRAFVGGEFYSGPGYNDGTVDVLKARVPDAYAALTGVLANSLPPGSAPFCTQCIENPWLTPPGSMPSGESTWTSTVFLSGFPITQVKKTESTLKDALVTFDPGGGAPAYMVPGSTYYGFRVVVRVDP